MSRALKHLILICWIPVTAYNQQTLVLQPGGACGKDAILHGLNSENTHNFGDQQQLSANSWTFNGVQGTVRSLLQFDLSTIPAGATVIHAELTLYAWDSNTGFGQHSTLGGFNNGLLQRVTTYWDEHTTTWQTQPATTNLHQVAVPVSTSPDQDYTLSVTQLVQDMLSDPENSFGFLLRLTTEVANRRLNFCSSDHPDPSRHPKLTITYTGGNPVDPYPGFLGKDTTLCAGKGIPLAAPPSYLSYHWQNSSVNPMLLTTLPGIYWVEATNCSGTVRDSIVISWTDCPEPPVESPLVSPIDFPNVFTPNADAANDYFVPLNNGKPLPEGRLTILNRWGNVLFQTIDLVTGWNGQLEGNACLEGVYFWQFELSGVAENSVMQGCVTLVR
jgi:gliding motility-associated-like protein